MVVAAPGDLDLSCEYPDMTDVSGDLNLWCLAGDRSELPGEVDLSRKVADLTALIPGDLDLSA